MPRSCFEPRRDRTQVGGLFAHKPDANSDTGRAFERPPTQILDATNHRNAVHHILHQGNVRACGD